MATTIRRDLLAQGLNRPMAPIVDGRLARAARMGRTPPPWARQLRALAFADFLRDYRRFQRLAQANNQPGASGKGVFPATLAEASADQLLALFLKLNAQDPGSDAENELKKLVWELRQKAAEAARQAAQAAQEAAEKAKEEAEAKDDPVSAAIAALLALLGA